MSPANYCDLWIQIATLAGFVVGFVVAMLLLRNT